MQIKMAADPFEPYQYINEGGDVCGLDYEIVKLAFSKVNHQVSVDIMDWPSLEKLVLEGALSGGFQVQPNAQRAKLFLFSDLLRNAVTEIISMDAGLLLDSCQGIADNCYSLGVMKGYSYGDIIDSLDAECKNAFSTHEDLLFALRDGEIDFAVIDRGVRVCLSKKLGIDGIHAYCHLDFIRPLHVIFNNNRADICEDFNKGLEIIRSTGEYENLLDKYLV